jgi:UDP-2,3-diacylglucosamine pyrophosphatase LpxH
MIVTDEGLQLFVGEIVEVLDDAKVKEVCSHGKVIKFMTKVKKRQSYQVPGNTDIAYCICDLRKQQGNFWPR